MSVWAVNGNIPDTTLRLTTSPTSLTPSFSFGCGSFDGTASCDLGSVYSGSASRQVIASVTVPATATAVTSVRLTTTASAAGLSTDPSAAVAVPVGSGTATGTPASSTSGSGTGTSTGAGSSSTVSPLPVGSLPTIGSGTATSSISPGGNAAGLFPTINPSAVPAPAPGQGESARPVANTEALPIGTPVIDAQLLGLGALGVAFLLAVTRLSVRRRPAAATASGRGAAVAASTASAGTAQPSAEPASAARPSTAWISAGPAKAEADTADDSVPDNTDATATADEVPAGEAVGAIPAVTTDLSQTGRATETDAGE